MTEYEGADWADLTGAFAHEVRTPLTAAAMVLQIASMDDGGDGAADDTMELDAELVDMLRQSLDELRELTDRLQETSRLARGFTRLNPQPTSLAALCAGALEATGLTIVVQDLPGAEGAWDTPEVRRSLGALARAADRIGKSSGTITVSGAERPGAVQLTMRSGVPRDGDDDAAPGGAYVLGFGYHVARLVLRMLGGDTTWHRGHGYGQVTVTLPRGQA